MSCKYKIVKAIDVEKMTNEEFNNFSIWQIEAIKSRRINRSTKEKLIEELSTKDHFVLALHNRETIQSNIDAEHKTKSDSVWTQHLKTILSEDHQGY